MGNSQASCLLLFQTPVHPHVHGELINLDYAPDKVYGSSPRAWGTHYALRQHEDLTRFIPTCMGNSHHLFTLDEAATVHPHVHGELLSTLSVFCMGGGSSPRAWGTRTSGIYAEGNRRFIPTCMGNSDSASVEDHVRAVHPHVHGELLRYMMSSMHTPGSSPRAWGTLICIAFDVVLKRFIPTCMGNSSHTLLFCAEYSVHPHVHGELRIEVFSHTDGCGSSPRAWGTPQRNVRGRRGHRFIPTCMGNSFLRTVQSVSGSVHPHVHGELELDRMKTEIDNGSSPRAWGTHLFFRSRCESNRFIPTCMGNSPPIYTSKVMGSVHPHVHGELDYKARYLFLSVGSSPRAWGTQTRQALKIMYGRFIPTCMGNSQPATKLRYVISVHPHVHGELERATIPHIYRVGSSPRAWGTRRLVSLLFSLRRFIPTCMGNSRRSQPSPVIITVHPHVHGELVSLMIYGSSKFGSSPRAWGTLVTEPPGREVVRVALLALVRSLFSVCVCCCHS